MRNHTRQTSRDGAYCVQCSTDWPCRFRARRVGALALIVVGVIVIVSGIGLAVAAASIAPVADIECGAPYDADLHATFTFPNPHKTDVETWTATTDEGVLTATTGTIPGGGSGVVEVTVPGPVDGPSTVTVHIGASWSNGATKTPVASSVTFDGRCYLPVNSESPSPSPTPTSTPSTSTSVTPSPSPDPSPDPSTSKSSSSPSPDASIATTSPPPVDCSAPGSCLPHTGAGDVIAIALGGLALILAGISLFALAMSRRS